MDILVKGNREKEIGVSVQETIMSHLSKKQRMKTPPATEYKSGRKRLKGLS